MIDTSSTVIGTEVNWIKRIIDKQDFSPKCRLCDNEIRQ